MDKRGGQTLVKIPVLYVINQETESKSQETKGKDGISD